MPTEANYVAGLALRCRRVEPMEQWIDPAPERGPIPLAENIGECLGSDNPFPDGAHVGVVRRDGGGWGRATVIERTAADGWTVEYDDGEQVWRDQQELRPHSPQAG